MGVHVVGHSPGVFMVIQVDLTGRGDRCTGQTRQREGVLGAQHHFLYKWQKTGVWGGF